MRKHIEPSPTELRDKHCKTQSTIQIGNTQTSKDSGATFKSEQTQSSYHLQFRYWMHEFALNNVGYYTVFIFCCEHTTQTVDITVSRLWSHRAITDAALTMITVSWLWSHRALAITVSWLRSNTVLTITTVQRPWSHGALTITVPWLWSHRAPISWRLSTRLLRLIGVLQHANTH